MGSMILYNIEHNISEYASHIPSYHRCEYIDDNKDIITILVRARFASVGDNWWWPVARREHTCANMAESVSQCCNFVYIT